MRNSLPNSQRLLRALLISALCLTETGAFAAQPESVIIDTDIGDDIDDAFALALALASPEIKVIGITTAWGDTATRARLVGRLLRETGRCDIPVAIGVPTKTDTPFTQRRWAEAYPTPATAQPQAVDFLLDRIRRDPGQITLVTIAPLTNIGGAIERDPETFRKLKRVVMMGGSIQRGYGGSAHAPDAEYNIRMDAAAARALFASGVPIIMMPLDSTIIRLEPKPQSQLFAHGTPTTDALTLLYAQWSANNSWNQRIPTLFDVVPVAAIVDPTLCPTTAARVEVDDRGFTRTVPGSANAAICLNSNPDDLLRLIISRILATPATPPCKQ